MKNYSKPGAMLLFALFLIVIGCQPAVVCNKPYIQVGADCCLDKDDNLICDSDETAPVQAPVKANESTVAAVANETSPSAAQNLTVPSNDTFSIDEALSSVVLVEIIEYDEKLGRDERTLKTGTGFFVSQDGEILTNMHVVSPFAYSLTEFEVRIRVKTKSGNYFDADLIDWNYDYDIALLKIKEKKTRMQHLSFASSSALKTGDTVYVLGNPLNLEQSVSKGIISAKGRSALHNETLKVYIQTDAAVNPGNSGGPIIDTEGKVAGIATYGAGQGLNFGLESDTAKRLYERMRLVTVPIPTAPLEKCYLGADGYIYRTSGYRSDNAGTKLVFSKPTRLNVFYDAARSELDFNSITLSFENTDSVEHQVCFSAKVMTDAAVILEKKLADFTVKPRMKMAEQEIMIGFTTGYLPQWYYYEINAVDCATGERYYTFARRDEYASDYEGGDGDVYREC